MKPSGPAAESVLSFDPEAITAGPSTSGVGLKLIDLISENNTIVI
jgi:hypothetical protein